MSLARFASISGIRPDVTFFSSQVMRALEVMSAQPGNQVIIVDSEDVVNLIGDVTAKHCDGVIGKGGGGGKLACAGRALSLAAKLAETAEVSGCRAVPAASLVPIISSALATNWSQVSVVIPSCTVLASLAKAKSEVNLSLKPLLPAHQNEMQTLVPSCFGRLPDESKQHIVGPRKILLV